MKKLLFFLPVVFLTLMANAQTEDEVHVGTYPKGKTFGNYKGPDIIIPDFDRKSKPVNGQTSITGIVVKVGWCEDDCMTMSVKKDDGTIVTVGTKDYGFAVSKKIVGSRIIVEGMDPAMLISDRKRKTVQKDIQVAATGIKVIK